MIQSVRHSRFTSGLFHGFGATVENRRKPSKGAIPLIAAGIAPASPPVFLSMDLNWKRPLFYLALPFIFVLVLVGVMPPFPPSRPTKPGQAQSEPSEKEGA